MKKYSLIISAMDEEMEALLKLLPNLNKINIKGEELFEFELNNQSYLLGRGKIGKVHTAVYLTKLFIVEVTRSLTIFSSISFKDSPDTI